MKRLIGTCVALCALVAASVGCEPPPTWWQPAKGLTWQWQLNSSTIDTTVDAQVYDVDGFEVSAATVDQLHAQGRKVICYISVGSWESYRPDADDFPPSALGDTVDGYPDERWLDIRQIDALVPVMSTRMDMCDAKGFDAVEGDLMDGYEASTGFPLTGADQAAWNRRMLGLAHERGLAMGLKNDLAQIPDLADEADFSVNEQCYQYDECDTLVPFIDLNKPVFHAEYSSTLAEFCPTSEALGLSSIRKRVSLDAWRQVCP